MCLGRSCCRCGSHVCGRKGNRRGSREVGANLSGHGPHSTRRAAVDGLLQGGLVDRRGATRGADGLVKGLELVGAAVTGAGSLGLRLDSGGGAAHGGWVGVDLLCQVLCRTVTMRYCVAWNSIQRTRSCVT